jgi:hypothetical protein
MIKKNAGAWRAMPLLIILFLLPIIIYFLWPSDESRIRKLFREGAAAIEAEQINEVMSKVSFNYKDEHGLSYLYLKKLMERAFSQMDDIEVEYKIRDIEIKDKKASTAVDVRVIASHGQERGYFLGDAADPVQMTFHLEKERTRWLVIGAEGMPSGWTM